MNKKSTKSKPRLVRKTADQIRRFTPEELQRFVDNRRDDAIDFSDIPRVSPERIAAMKPAGERIRRRRAG